MYEMSFSDLKSQEFYVKEQKCLGECSDELYSFIPPVLSQLRHTMTCTLGQTILILFIFHL